MYLGIDLTASAKRASACALLDAQGQLVALDCLREDQELLALVRRWRPRVVAIDAPLSLPRGLCCLEEDCPCQPLAADGLKAAEREVRRAGYGLYFTTKRSIIKAMAYRGIGLRLALEREAITMMEVYPYAAKRRLFGPLPKKSTPAGIEKLRYLLPQLVNGLDWHLPLLTHDEADALVAAYTAYLHVQGRTESLGDPGEGVIVLPAA